MLSIDGESISLCLLRHFERQEGQLSVYDLRNLEVVLWETNQGMLRELFIPFVLDVYFRIKHITC